MSSKVGDIEFLKSSFDHEHELSVNFTKLNLKKPYLTQNDVLNWLSSRPCPNWSEEIFKKSLWPQSALGESGREIPPGYQSYAAPLVGLPPKGFILLEIFIDFFWGVPLDENGQSKVEQVHIDFSLAMTSSVLKYIFILKFS